MNTKTATTGSITHHNDVDAKFYISSFLSFTPDYLTPVSISRIESEEYNHIKRRIIPRFCFDNSLTTAISLDLHSIVYGAAIVSFGEQKIPVEHAWVKSHDGQYYDPTYQELGDKDTPLQVEYYSLFEMPLDDYLALATEVRGEQLSKICALDFMPLRHMQHFKRFFKRVTKPSNTD